MLSGQSLTLRLTPAHAMRTFSASRGGCLRLPARHAWFAAQPRSVETNFANNRESRRQIRQLAKSSILQRSTTLCGAESRVGIARCETNLDRVPHFRWILFAARSLRLFSHSAAYLLPRELQRLSPSTAGLRTAGPPPAVPIVARPFSFQTVICSTHRIAPPRRRGQTTARPLSEYPPRMRTYPNCRLPRG
jgi:hypothetical protein